MNSLKDNINGPRLPKHVAIIMDGNGRWAKKKGAIRVFGHSSAIESVRQVIEGAAEIGIQFLTLFAFSTENWGRPKEEVDALMELLVATLQQEVPSLKKNNVRLQSIGDTSQLPRKCENSLKEAIEETAKNKGLTLTIALNYSGRWEIVNAATKISELVESKQLKISDINESFFTSQLETASMPDPELLIRTSGEMRISNFLLWQIAYTELYITPKLWPDFRKDDLYEALIEYQKRERRFGKVLSPIN